jgi:membrane protein
MGNKAVGQLKRFSHFLKHDLWRIDLVHDTKLRSFGVESLRVLHLLLKGVKEDRCFLHASALTYATLMALAPFLIIVFAIANAVGYARARHEILGAIQTMPEQLQVFITDLLRTIDGISPAALGGVTGVIFLYIVFKLLSGIEESFNQIWGVQASRAIGDKIRNYISVMVIAPALMLVAQTASGVLTTFSGRMEWIGPFLKPLLQLAPVGVLALAFVAIFIFLPNTKVNFKAASIGALTSATLAILLQVFLIVFGKAIFSSEKYGVYGSFAAIPVFLFWMHLNWTILLFGAELAFAVQNRGTYAEEQAAVRASTVSKLWVAFSVMQKAVQVFQGPEPSFNTTAYARDSNIPIRLMREVVELLSRAGLLGEVKDQGEGSYALLRAPEHVTAKKIYDLIVTDGSSPRELGLAADAAADEMLTITDVSLDKSLTPITLFRFMSEG